MRDMRLKPYTQIGIRRIPCSRCGEPSAHQWQVCALGREFKGLCEECDYELNALVLAFITHPEAEKLLREYRKKLGLEPKE